MKTKYYCRISLSGPSIMLDQMAATLAALRQGDQFSDLRSPAGIPRSSNDYLALAMHPELKDAITRAVSEDARVASTGSRLLSGNDARWEHLESDFAGFVGAEAALYFPSGYA